VDQISSASKYKSIIVTSAASAATVSDKNNFTVMSNVGNV